VSAGFDAKAASVKGVEMRRARAEFKAALARGEFRFLEVYDQAESEDASQVLRGLRVEWFLRSIPGFGVTKTRALLERLGISATATLGGLRVRQRTALRAEVATLYRRYFPHQRGVLVVLAGPSGVGKGTIVSWITGHFPEFVVSVSATTRPQRPGEKDGEHYYFVSATRFEELVRADELLEWALVHGSHYYGTPRAPVDELLDQGKNVILEIDVQGAKQVKRHMKNSLSVFIAPPSFSDLEDRLVRRGTEDERERRRRLMTAKRELGRQSEFDYVVINASVEESGQSIVDLALASKDPQSTKE